HSYKDLINDVSKDIAYYKDKKDHLKRLIDLARYIKNYEATLERNGRAFKKYRFSDEREWRYVPPFSESCRPFYTDQNFQREGVAEAAAASVSSFRLKFKPNDVKYIIIKNDREI